MDVTFNGATIRLTIDEYPPLDYLGEYRSIAGPEERTIDRKEQGDYRPGEKRYFVAAHTPEETGNEDSVMQDYERMEAYGNEWWMLNVRAEASVTVGMTRQTIQSEPLGGVGSDTGEHIREVGEQKLVQLAEVLDILGIDRPDPIEADFSGPSSPSGTVEVSTQ